MATDDAMTCGKGIAMHAALPERLSDLAGSMASVLENHLRSLSTDDASQPERAAYVQLVHEWRSIASSLASVATRMSGYRDLPMATHDEKALASPTSVETFASYVDSERSLLELLQQWVQRDEAMLADMS